MTTLVANKFNGVRLSGISNFFKKLRTQYSQYKTYKHTVNELQKLTDRELRDLGISRGMIHSIAMEVYTDNHEVNPNLKGWV